MRALSLVVVAIAAAALVAAARTQSPPAPGVAAHDSFGAGCHRAARESFHWHFADASAAAAGLVGRRLTLTPTPLGYDATWGTGGYHAPTAAATSLPPSDDGQVAVTLPAALPTPTGQVATIHVHSNGIVAFGPGIDGGSWNTPPNDFTPSAAFRDAPDTAFFAWHDWNPAEPGSGRIVTDRVVVDGETVFCVTWRDVENFPAGVVNRGTFQFQFGLGTGRVTYVWVAVDASTMSPFGTGHLVGYSPAGPSLESAALATGASWISAPDARELTLVASPPPVSTASIGTSVRYDVANAPAVVDASPVRLGLLLLSLTSDPAGLELAPLGAPGCRAFVGSIDWSFLLGGTTADLTVNVMFPPALPPGLDVFAQAIALLPPQRFGADHNSLGVITSNGIRSHVELQ